MSSAFSQVRINGFYAAFKSAYLTMTLALLAPLVNAEEARERPSNDTLLTEELRDAETRRRNELNSRVDEVEAQADTIRQLTERQAEYIEQLKARIDALEAQGSVE